MPKHIYTTQEAVRMVGHLLEYHPTTGEAARDKSGGCVYPCNSKASCFCLLGACKAVTGAIVHENRQSYYEQLRDAVALHAVDTQHWTAMLDAWEGAGTSPATRLAIARKLQQT